MNNINKIKFFFRDTLLPNSLFLMSKTSREKKLYLTFDDGPVPEALSPLLELLDKYQVKATFFVIGSRGERHVDLLNEIHQKQHTLANHSYTHPNFHKITHDEQCFEIHKTNQLIEKITKQPCRLFRAPQGRWNVKLLWHLFKKNIVASHWSRDSLDFTKKPAHEIITDFNKQPVQSGDIILFHDDAKFCIEVLTVLIPQWQAQGFTLSAL